jgi:hypothetical protein
VLAELAAAGWVPCGVGDWAVALRSPEGSLVARVCPFDPAYWAFVDLCRGCAGNRWLPRIELAAGLEGGGLVVFLEYVAPVDQPVVKQFAEQWQARTGDAEFQEVRRAARRIDAEYRKSTPWWGGYDLDDAHIFRAADRPVLLDFFCMAGTALYDAILEDVAGVHRLIPRERIALRPGHPVYRPGEQHRRDPCPQKGLGTRCRMTREAVPRSQSSPDSADHGTGRTAAAPIILICIRCGLPRHTHVGEQIEHLFVSRSSGSADAAPAAEPCRWPGLGAGMCRLSRRGHYRLAGGCGRRCAAGFCSVQDPAPARTGWQLSGKGSRKRVCSGIGGGRRVGARPGSGFPEEPVPGGVSRPRW